MENQQSHGDTPVTEAIPESPRNDRISLRALTETSNGVSTANAELDDPRIEVKLKEMKDGKWEIADTILVRPNNILDTGRWLWKYERKFTRWELKTKSNKRLDKQTCLQDVIRDGTYTIYLHPPGKDIKTAKTLTVGETLDLIPEIDRSKYEDNRDTAKRVRG